MSRMRRITLPGRLTPLLLCTAFVVSAGAPNFARAQAQQDPQDVPQGYAPPQQVYTVDVYEESTPAPAAQTPYVPPATQQPSRRLVIPYEDGMEVPPGAYVRSRSRMGLWIPGVVIFGSSYVVSGLFGMLGTALRNIGGSGEADARVWIPLVGPLIVAETQGGRTVAGFSMAVQSVGLALTIAGLASRRRELVYYTDRGRGLSFGAAPLPRGAMVSLNVF